MSKRVPLPPPRIRALREADIDAVVASAGGRRAYDDVERRTERNADYRLGKAIIELKMLDDEGLRKRERQTKLAALFGRYQHCRPVVVLDPRLLPRDAMREYARIMEGPVRKAVSKGRAQLKQSRMDDPEVTATILFVINNGFAALTHDELVEHVVRRARNDTDEIDGVVIAGCYFHSDGFDTVALWPINYVCIHPERPFSAFHALKTGWDSLAERHMTDFVRGEHGPDAEKHPVADIAFDVDGVTYVKPAPPFGDKSKFYGYRRPRFNGVDFDELPPVATTIPKLTGPEFRRFRAALPDEPLLASYESWLAHVEDALTTGEELNPVVLVEVTRGGWESWRRHRPECQGLQSVRSYANHKFNRKARELILAANEMSDDISPPRRYIAVGTEVIGQNERNDLSHIASVLQRRNAPRELRTLVSDARIPHEHAVALAAAYAILGGVELIFWHRDLRFAWT